MREPVVLGVNVTSMVQPSLGASELGQRLVGLKLLASAPVTPALEMSNAVVPVFVTVTFCVLLWPTSTVPKFRLYGLMLARGLITVIFSLTCCGLPAALSAMLSVAVSVPTWSGWEKVLMVQLLPAVSLDEQPLPMVKSPELVPGPRVKDTPLMLSGEVPMFFTVTVSSCIAL